MEDYVTHAEHEEFAKRIEEHNRRSDARISELEDGQKKQTDILISLNSLTSATKQIAENQQRQERKIDGITARIEVVEQQPVKTWWSFKSAVVGALGAAMGSGLIYMLIQALNH